MMTFSFMRMDDAVAQRDRLRIDHATDLGVVLAMLALPFTARIVCEQTLLAWTSGAGAPEFSPTQLGIDAVGLFCVLIGLVWAFAVVAFSLAGRQRIGATNRWSMLLLLLCSALWLVPYPAWKLLTVRVAGAEHTPKSWILEAAATGDIHLLDYVLANDADVNVRTRSGQSPLGAAAAAGRIDIARWLLARGANVENRTLISGETPLLEAAQMNRPAMVNLLLDQGANPRAKDVLGFTALDWAERNGDLEIVQRLRGDNPHR